MECDTRIEARDECRERFVVTARPGQVYVRLTVNVRMLAERERICLENQAIRKAGR